mgnify:CR=1 FL=1|tara:strand:- start:379 stop:663 length:285 start_codon:yes stop_codon:yes gene_type:complete
MKLLLVNLIVALALLQGCIPTDKYDTQYTVPSRTFEGVLLDVTVHYQVRCGAVGNTIVVLDTHGQIAWLGGIITPAEALVLEGMARDHARTVCN